MTADAAADRAAGLRPGPEDRARWSLPSEVGSTLGEGRTQLVPAPALGRALGVADLWLKREDGNPTGSHKDRALAIQCAALRASGRPGVLSSSGNGAVAAAAYAALEGVPVVVLVSPRTPEVKLRALARYPGILLVSPAPVACLRRAVDAFGCEDLRPSVHPLAPMAYRAIAWELESGLAGDRAVDAVFAFASSGATMVGLAEGFGDRPGGGPQLHAVRGSGAAGGGRPFELGAQRGRRHGAVRRLVGASGGRSWPVDAAGLEPIRVLAAACGVTTSWEGIAVLAAIRQAAQLLGGRRVAALLTGEAAQLDCAPDPTPLGRSGLDWVGDVAALDRRLVAAGLGPPAERR